MVTPVKQTLCSSRGREQWGRGERRKMLPCKVQCGCCNDSQPHQRPQSAPLKGHLAHDHLSIAACFQDHHLSCSSLCFLHPVPLLSSTSPSFRFDHLSRFPPCLLMKQRYARGHFPLYQYSMPITRVGLLTLTQGTTSRCSALLLSCTRARCFQ